MYRCTYVLKGEAVHLFFQHKRQYLPAMSQKVCGWIFPINPDIEIFDAELLTSDVRAWLSLKAQGWAQLLRAQTC